MTDKNEEKIRIGDLEDMTKQHRNELDSYDVDFRKMLARIQKLEAQVEELLEVEEQLNKVNDELDHALNMANKVEDLIAAWNNRFPDDPIYIPRRRRRESDYIMTDDEWKERTRIPHPRDWVKKSFDPSTGEFQ